MLKPIHRNDPVRLIRAGIVIHEGKLAQLKRFKDDVKEVKSGFECGLNFVGYEEIEVGDMIGSLMESYEIIRIKINGQLKSLNGLKAIILAQPDSAFSEKR